MAQKRRKKGIVICVAGMTGCGKTTLAKRLAEKYGLQYFSGGSSLKALAIKMGYKPCERGWWETEEGRRFIKQRMENHGFDERVDRDLMEMAKKGNVVLDSWTMPWLLKNGFKVWLDASLDVRARRLAQRDGISFEEAVSLTKEKDEKTKRIYKSLYGFNLGEDPSPFNLIIDTNELSSDEVFKMLSMTVDRLLLGRRVNKL